MRDEVIELRDKGLVEFWIETEPGVLRRAEEPDRQLDWRAESSWEIPSLGAPCLMVTLSPEGHGCTASNGIPRGGGRPPATREPEAHQ